LKWSMSTDTPISENFELTRKSILELSHKDAHNFFLKPESYCTLDLPHYITFGSLLTDVDTFLKGKALSDLTSKPREHDDINYTILNNKDGKYAWRPFQLIHPVLYVSLIHQITAKNNWKTISKRFCEFSLNNRINCLSMPYMSLTNEKDKAEQVSHWWHEVEQKSIMLSLDYAYVIETDITDCYRAIYTHSIAWALHSKTDAKTKRNDKNLIGNVIDNYLQDMQHGQTNGIPQGSTLMDFIAEMILGYADLELSNKLAEESVEDYYILRYRDDYRVFVNSQQEGDKIIKLLTEVMINLGLKLNPSKTKVSNDIVYSSVKIDKLKWTARKQSEKSIQKHLLIIHDHAREFTNSGSLIVALNKYHNRILQLEYLIEQAQPLIAIIVDIAYRNPRAYPICAAIMSKLISFIKTHEEKQSIIKKTKSKFSQIPNTEYMQIWLQRIAWPFFKEIYYKDPVCNLISGNDEKIWNTDWITASKLKAILDSKKIVDNDILTRMNPVIQPKEIELFISRSTSEYH
jgi:RNA-directed DNA polymerase